ncbi:MAG: CoA-binding protein [Thaumarchaeota archaeon]|nr:CoA-binding protein [Nitrososphaerota archaeon]
MKTIAVVGFSKDPSKESHSVSIYMREHGYEIIPVNPTAEEIMGLRSYPSLLAIPDDLKKRIDVINIFRRPNDVPPVVDDAIKLKNLTKKPLAIWMQLGIVNEEAAKQARVAGIEVVMDACIRTEHRKRL